MKPCCLLLFCLLICCITTVPVLAASPSSTNISLDSPIYLYLDKLAGFGLIATDVKGIKPFSKAEAARLLLEAENNLSLQDTSVPAFARELVARVRELIPREIS